MPVKEPARVYVAPEPVLGLVASVGDQQEGRLRKTARAAIGFATAGAVGSTIVLGAVFVEMAVKSPRSKFDMLFGFLLMLSPISMLIGFILGIVARKTRMGKAAIAVSLIPVALVALFLASAVVMGIVAGIRKS